ncbi:WD40 repeat domain-containing protein [Merismopedia glauca]|uniref:Anaphase-promoting complex subunit 4 WD40 domain-containing protein n=1 Tax=Merismopedia glauca CCAP 1448/3 TaxID=1296344 RepID=A0A2T1C2X3_9CYAN|nr:hypothetical protein [Merismopedia glauca]PSB02625.1 hypothetical protein C7B64_12310 [Merismopedia glauca CCAP 1448/3]
MKTPSAILLSLILGFLPFQTVLVPPATAQNSILNLLEFKIRPQLQQAMQSKKWQKAIESVDKLISITSDSQKLSDLRSYRANLSRKLANATQVQNSSSEEPKTTPETLGQPPIPKPKIDPNAPPSPWANIKLQKILKARTPVLAAAIGPSGKILVTGGKSTLEIWDLSTDKSRLITDWISEAFGISYEAIAFHPDGRYFATNSNGIAQKTSHSDNDGSSETVSLSFEGSASQVWNVETGNQVLTFKDFTQGYIASFDKNGGVLLVGEYIWDVNSQQQLFRLPKFTPQSMTVRQYEQAQEDRLSRFKSKCRNATPLSPDGKSVSVFGSNSVDIYSVQTGNKITSLSAKDPALRTGCIGFSADGQTLALASGSRVIVWWLSTGEVLHDIDTSTKTDDVYAQAAIFSPDSQVLAVGNTKQAIALYDMRSGKKITTLSGSFVGFHPNSTSLITTEGANVKIWSVP